MRATERKSQEARPAAAASTSLDSSLAAWAAQEVSELLDLPPGADDRERSAQDGHMDIATSAAQDGPYVSWLAEQIERVLRDEARRHGIGL